MISSPRLVTATEEHMERLVRVMKPDHIRELAWFGFTPASGTWGSFHYSRASAAALAGGELLFCAGVSAKPFNKTGDAIWMLATDAFDRHVRTALRLTRYLFDVEAWKYSKTRRLEQYLPPPYRTGIRFLEWLGWKRGDVVSMGSRQAVHMFFDKPEGETWEPSAA